MSRQILNRGSAPGAGDGDSAYVGGGKINDNFEELYGYINLMNRLDIIETANGFSLVDQDLTINADWVWFINNSEYTNPDAVAFLDIAFSASGNSRLVYIVPNATNGFTMIDGDETTGTPATPALPNGGMYVTYFVVTDTTIETPADTYNGDSLVNKENISNKTDVVAGNETSSSLYASIKGIVDWFSAAKIRSILGITTLSGENTGDQDLSSYAPLASPAFTGTVTGIDKTMVGLSDVDNTADLDKPVSTAQAAADAQVLADANAYTDSGLALKLDASAYNDRYKGKYTSLGALETAHPTANAGDYAQVDAGSGSDVVNYNWDAEEGWVEGGSGSGATNTDALPEGSSNLYFTTARVLATVLTGISFVTGGEIVSTDSVLVAFGKLQKQINDLLTAVGLKQDALVSGTNIKTINGSSILGSGDIVVGSGDMTTNTDQTVSGIKTFLAGKFGLRNAANTFTSFFTNANTASRTYTLQNRNGTLADDTDLGLKVNKAGDTMTGQLVLPASTSTLAPIRLPEGVTKSTSPTTGDIQNLTDVVQIRKNSAWYSFMFANAPNTDLNTGASKAMTVDSTGMPTTVDLQSIVVNTVALVSGVATITISGVTTSSICMGTQIITPSGTLSNSYKAVCTASTLTITAIDTAGSTVTTDNSTLSYTVLL